MHICALMHRFLTNFVSKIKNYPRSDIVTGLHVIRFLGAVNWVEYQLHFIIHNRVSFGPLPDTQKAVKRKNIHRANKILAHFDIFLEQKIAQKFFAHFFHFGTFPRSQDPMNFQSNPTTKTYLFFIYDLV